MGKQKKVLITGGSGNLGQAIQKLMPCIAPDQHELDITDLASCKRAIKKYKPDIIIHCAAWTDVAGAEKNKDACWAINVTGTQNLVRAADGRRVVYISTDYVFDGEQGNYTEEDTPSPQNFYALTKLAGELIMRQYEQTLIIRTAFKKDGPWPYEKAFVDQWASHEFVSVLAPQILQAALMTKLVGVIHIAGARKSIYELARQATPSVGKMSRSDVAVHIPRDTSLNISKWQTISSKSNRAKK